MSEMEEEYFLLFGSAALLKQGLTENEDDFQARVKVAVETKTPLEHFDDLDDVEY